MKGGELINKCIYSLWAKKKVGAGGSLLWLPLLQHLEDTKNVAERLWDRWLSPGQRKLIEDSVYMGDKAKVRDLACFIACTHDLGKATSSFSIKKSFSSVDLDKAILENMERAGFRGISGLKLLSSDKTPHNIASQYLLNKFGVAEDIATIVGGHHGKPVDKTFDFSDDEDDYLSQKSYPENYYQVRDENSEVHKLWEESQREIFDWALNECNFKDVKEIPRIGRPAQVILMGLLIMADWIASSEDFFGLIPIDSDEAINMEERIKGYQKWEIKEAWQSKSHVGIDDLYEKRFSFQPRKVQKEFSRLIEEADRPGIFILEAPMGLGKTEAALIGAEQLAFKSGCNGLFFGLPTQATSNGIFPRIVSWLESVGKEGKFTNLRLSHSKAYLNEDLNNLPYCNPRGDDKQYVTINQWFSGRKTAVLDEFVVGTVDQFLMTALKQKHLALRHLGFSKKVIVIDEVHAYDAYMNQYLLQSLKWMGAYGIPVILLSATLPKESRTKLIAAYIEGANPQQNETITLNSHSYPLITYSDGNEIKQFDDFIIENDKRISVLKISDEQLLEQVEDLLSDGGILGIVLNTVKRAQEIGHVLSEKFGEDVVEILHSGFIATERVRKEKELLDTIGKDGERPYKKIIVGTQVIEQSLDIDFDVMISDLAPVDLLLQRMGRLHRHDNLRTSKLSEPKLYILGCNENMEFDSGSSNVYGNYFLARTQSFLPRYIDIPSDISSLVQDVYGEVEMEIGGVLREKYLDFKLINESIIKSKETRAKGFRIGNPIEKKGRREKTDLVGWLEKTIPEDNDERAYAQVRDSDDTIEVIALVKMDNGYSLIGKDEDISDEIFDDNVAKEIASNTINLPRLLTKNYNIDETIETLEGYNITYLSDWQESKWLKGALGVIFEKEDIESNIYKFELGDYRLIYDKKYGIFIERK